MGRYDRWGALLELLAKHGKLEVDDAARELDVSAATIRRDLDQLAQQQMLTRTRGGAVAHSVSYDLPLRYKEARNATEKQRIAVAAANLVQPGQTVAVNGGTTMTEVARALVVRSDLHGVDGAPALTVVTNALNIAAELTVRQQVKLVVTGGVARPQSYELIGPLATGILHEVALDVAIIGVNAVDIEHGASAHHEGEADINQLMVNQAARVVVVADSSKLGRRAFARICPTVSIDVLVTDVGAPAELVDRFSEAGVQVITV